MTLPEEIEARIQHAIWGKQTRDAVAAIYAEGLRFHLRDRVDWKLVNGEILDRWSPSGLDYIKKAAWKHHDAMVRALAENPMMVTVVELREATS